MLAQQVDYATHGFPPATEKAFKDAGVRILRPPIYSGPALNCNHTMYPFNVPEVRRATLLYTMQAAAENDIAVIVCDRPNPIGGEIVEGPVLAPGYESFVGAGPLPIRHGLTIGELARLFNKAWHVDCNLTVVPCSGWRRTMWYKDTGLRHGCRPPPRCRGRKPLQCTLARVSSRAPISRKGEARRCLST